MNSKELGEIKRRFKVERTNASRIRGAVVNEKKEIISRFDQSLNLMSEEDAQSILNILKKTLSGKCNILSFFWMKPFLPAKIMARYVPSVA